MAEVTDGQVPNVVPEVMPYLDGEILDRGVEEGMMRLPPRSGVDATPPSFRRIEKSGVGLT